MKLKIAALAGALAVAAALPAAADAATWGYTTTNANFRAAPGGAVIGTIPVNSRVNVITYGSWDKVAFHGRVGFVSASLISSQYVQAGPSVTIHAGAPTHGYFQKPWWDNQHQAWYDGHRWYRNGIWYNTPNFGFGFSFGG